MLSSRWILVFFVCLFLPLQLFPEDVSVNVEADQYASAGQPINVTVMVTHESSNRVDPNSFKFGKDPQNVEFIKEVRISPQSDIVISLYQFTMPAQKEGVYTLPPLTVKVGGKEYTSNENSYEVD